MERKHKYIRNQQVTKSAKLVFVLIFFGILLLNLFIFRGVISHAPQIMQGQASVTREELVPFFEFKSQYLGEDLSDLTDTDEFRTSYSFWTSWVRYNSVLPFALVIMNTVSAFLIICSFYLLARHFRGGDRRLHIYASVISGLLIYFILLYAKIAHFYTLIFGFSLFALATSSLFEYLFYGRKFEYPRLLMLSFIALINPSVHFHVIFYLIALTLLALQGVVVCTGKGSVLNISYARNVLFVFLMILFSAVPYALFIQATTSGASTVFQSTPVNYWLITFSSVPLQYLFSLDSLGHVDLYRHGNYLAPTPRALTAVAYLPILAIFFSKQWRRLDIHRKMILFTLFGAVIIAIWMSIGYSNSKLYSFHNVLSLIASYVSGGSGLGQSVLKLLDTFINVLRFPHRFEFILFYAVGALLAIGLTWLMDSLRTRGISRQVTLGVASLFLIIPIVGSKDYRQTFFSGDFGGFLAPYTIPADLQHIKKVLADSDSNKLFILPSLESARGIAVANNNYAFLDKFFIYYLNQPTVYYGGGADTTNKAVSYMVYRSLSQNQTWGESILINDLGITHVLVPKHTEIKRGTTQYFPGIERHITNSFNHSKRFEKVYDGPDYALYEAKAKQNKSTNTLVDMSWGNFLTFAKQHSFGDKQLSFPIQLNKEVSGTQPSLLLTDSPEKSYYLLYSWLHKQAAYPNPGLLPFTADLVPSSNFTANAFSLTALYNKKTKENYTHEVVPSLLNLPSTQFVGLVPHSRAKISFKLKVEHAGKYRLLLHAASQLPAIDLVINGKKQHFVRVDNYNQTKAFIDFSYYKSDIDLTSNVVRADIESKNSSILAESMYALPSDNIPVDFNHVNLSGITMAPTLKTGEYTLGISKP